MRQVRQQRCLPSERSVRGPRWALRSDGRHPSNVRPRARERQLQPLRAGGTLRRAGRRLCGIGRRLPKRAHVQERGRVLCRRRPLRRQDEQRLQGGVRLPGDGSMFAQPWHVHDQLRRRLRTRKSMPGIRQVQPHPGELRREDTRRLRQERAVQSPRPMRGQERQVRPRGSVKSSGDDGGTRRDRAIDSRAARY